MRLNTTLWASVFLAALAAGSLGGVDPATLAFGIAPAEAKEFYTRKRVRGRWITGHFVRRHSAATRRGLKSGAIPAADYRGPDDPDRTTAALKPNSAAEPRNTVEPARPVGGAQPGASAALLDAAPLARDERVMKLQEALHAHARTLAVNTEPASGGLTSAGGLINPQPVHTFPEPKAVSFDFQSGVKTTMFTDGTLVEEPFDPAAMKGLATARPLRAAGASGR